MTQFRGVLGALRAPRNYLVAFKSSGMSSSGQGGWDCLLTSPITLAACGGLPYLPSPIKWAMEEGRHGQSRNVDNRRIASRWHSRAVLDARRDESCPTAPPSPAEAGEGGVGVGEGQKQRYPTSSERYQLFRFPRRGFRSKSKAQNRFRGVFRRFWSGPLLAVGVDVER